MHRRAEGRPRWREPPTRPKTCFKQLLSSDTLAEHLHRLGKTLTPLRSVLASQTVPPRPPRPWTTLPVLELHGPERGVKVSGDANFSASPFGSGPSASGALSS